MLAINPMVKVVNIVALLIVALLLQTALDSPIKVSTKTSFIARMSFCIISVTGYH